MNKMKQKFTLIELLVVVAIIGILASLLLPSLGRARQNGIKSVCVGNQKQIALAIQNAADDNDGHLYASNTSNIAEGKLTYAYFLTSNNYAAYEMFRCPNRTEDININNNGVWNGWTAYGAQYENQEPYQIKLDNFSAGDWLLGDALQQDNTDSIFRMTTGNQNSYASPHLIHLNKANMLFFDGHVEGLNGPTLQSTYGFTGVFAQGGSLF